jgi:hypothetical protein
MLYKCIGFLKTVEQAVQDFVPEGDIDADMSCG